MNTLGKVLLQKTVDSKGPVSVVLIRLMVGSVFLSEGIQKFLFPDEVGAGRFLKIGSLSLVWPFQPTAIRAKTSDRSLVPDASRERKDLLSSGAIPGAYFEGGWGQAPRQNRACIRSVTNPAPGQTGIGSL